MCRYFLPLLLGLPLLAPAQTAPGRHATMLDLTGAAGPTLNYTSIAGWRLWGLDAAGRFQAGVGVRGSYYFADALALDPQGGATQQLFVPSPRTGAVNVAFHVRARVAGPLRLGFNLDVGGVSFGPTRAVTFERTNNIGAAQPTSGNLLLGGSKDRGSLNSELYASLALPADLSVRVGYSHIVTGYEEVGPDARYRRFRNLAALGLSYQLP
ncbi:hypothetical protein QMK33_07690 [Hymenobacter sp. H14-R3]|uniref:hypothetical protein n=1 Tax=Hymenobacter sp. H14-R3 TaxID=3046308 RepID=UPI0024BBB277|nr:hypothetical protein [Hymenobacter sp. H14-R3]MDJ0365031.1 hypothetical protein [Hymenobacter sp. H14-R3]